MFEDWYYDYGSLNDDFVCSTNRRYGNKDKRLSRVDRYHVWKVSSSGFRKCKNENLVNSSYWNTANLSFWPKLSVWLDDDWSLAKQYLIVFYSKSCIYTGNIRGRELFEVLDTFFCFRGAGIIRGYRVFNYSCWSKAIVYIKEWIILK